MKIDVFKKTIMLSKSVVFRRKIHPLCADFGVLATSHFNLRSKRDPQL